MLLFFAIFMKTTFFHKKGFKSSELFGKLTNVVIENDYQLEKREHEKS